MSNINKNKIKNIDVETTAYGTRVRGSNTVYAIGIEGNFPGGYVRLKHVEDINRVLGTDFTNDDLRNFNAVVRELETIFGKEKVDTSEFDVS
jgi:hypothetical protein